MTIGIKDGELLNDPWDQFGKWYLQAQECDEISYPHAFTLSTLNPMGFPEGRVVLMKDYNKSGLIFYTNLYSVKGMSLKTYPRAGISFYWDPLGRQVRMFGSVTNVSNEDADEYFSSRSRESQLGAWASSQSKPISSRAELIAKLDYYRDKFKNSKIQRPSHWSGLKIEPLQFEFWQFGDARLHDRFLYTKDNENIWSYRRLQP